MSSIDLAIAEHSVQPTLQRLKRLCLDDPDPKFLCDLLMFVGTRESTEIHADWASESDHGAGLERLARAVWGNPTLLEAIDPRRTALRVEERYSPKELRLQYPAAFAAARRPLQSEVTSRWIQRLRHYLMIRQLDALEANAPREKHIYDVAVTVRDVCQMTSHPRLAWLEPLVGLATSLIEFEADTIIRARQARRAAQDSISAQASSPEAAEAAKAAKAQVRFYDALLAILEHKPWDPMPVALPPSNGRHLPPYPSAPGWGDLAGFIDTLRREPTSQPTQIGDPDHGGLTLVPQQTSKRHSQKTKQRLGTKVRLEHLAETLCLPVQWTATTSGEDGRLGVPEAGLPEAQEPRSAVVAAEGQAMLRKQVGREPAFNRGHALDLRRMPPSLSRAVMRRPIPQTLPTSVALKTPCSVSVSTSPRWHTCAKRPSYEPGLRSAILAT